MGLEREGNRGGKGKREKEKTKRERDSRFLQTLFWHLEGGPSFFGSSLLADIFIAEGNSTVL